MSQLVIRAKVKKGWSKREHVQAGYREEEVMRKQEQPVCREDKMQQVTKRSR